MTILVRHLTGGRPMAKLLRESRHLTCAGGPTPPPQRFPTTRIEPTSGSRPDPHQFAAGAHRPDTRALRRNTLVGKHIDATQHGDAEPATERVPTQFGPAIPPPAPAWSILGWHLRLGTCVERTEERKRVFGD
ncbi:MAG: hypothetical protein J0H22_00940 [Actinobacteria bacterium]|nr:hypothetical protein [Actinomycetota bacterium]